MKYEEVNARKNVQLAQITNWNSDIDHFFYVLIKRRLRKGHLRKINQIPSDAREDNERYSQITQ